MTTPKRSGKKQKAKAIGVFLSSTDDKFENALLRGLADIVTRAGENLICFTSGAIRSYHGFESQRNLLYDLVKKENFDGLVISGTLGHNISHEELLVFCAQYQPLQLVTVAMGLEGIPAVLNGSRLGIVDVVTHLIEVHGYKEIAFLRGPSGHQEADERYQAYCDTLQAHNIPVRDELVAQGDYTFDSGRTAIQKLLSQSLQAIVSANDTMALGVMEVLAGKGKRVPTDIALTGFDDTEASHQCNPPLTTLHQSVYEMGRQAGKTLLDIAQKKDVPKSVAIPPRLVIRNSCGCADQSLNMAGTLTTITSDQHWKTASVQDAMLKLMRTALSTPSDELTSTWTTRLIRAFEKELESDNSPAFLHELEEILHHSLAIGEDSTQWQDVISIMRAQILPHLDDAATAQRAEALWQQSRILIGTQILKAEERQRLRIEHRNIVLREISEALMSSVSRDDVLDVLALDLPRLGIEACYLSLFEDRQQTMDWAHLIFAYASDGRLNLPPEGKRFPSRELIPDEVLMSSAASTWVAEALYAKEERLGFMLLNVAPENANGCGAIRGLVSNALQTAILNERRMAAEEQLLNHQKNLEQEVEARTLALRKTNEQLQQEISERQRAEVELETLVKELESKNAELERFTYTVSHDLKSPLVTISGFLSYLEEDARKGQLDKLKQDINRIHDATAKMKRLLDELLELSRIGRLINPSQNVNFEEVIQDALGLVKGRLDEGKIEVQIGSDFPHVYGDRVRLVEVMQNLVDNASKFMAGQPDPKIEIGHKWEDGKNIIFVKDNGIGIEPQYHAKIFELFDKLDPKSDGTGIGLTLVKRIVNVHGGEIWVESQGKGSGTTFCFTLPQKSISA